jgi:phosphate transport system permease protein
LTTVEIDPRYDITVRSSGLGRRRKVEKLVAAVAILSALLACAMLFVVLGSVLLKGVSQLDVDFFTKSKPLFGQKGGIADAMVGSLLIVGMSILFAVPLAVLVAIYVSEYANPTAARFFRLVLDVLNGVPAIVVGIFIYGLLVLGHGYSAIYAALALAILMLPMVSRATQEVLALVPRSLREASLALGVPRWRTVYSIVLPTAIGGILTGVVLAVARVAGETAPILFTSSIITSSGVSTDVTHALQSLPLAIFVFSESPDPNDQAAGWAAALVLIAFVLVMNVLAKTFAGRKRRSLEGKR